MRDDQADELTAATYVRETGLSDAELETRGLMRNASRSKRGALIGRHAREELWTRFSNGKIKPKDAEIVCELTRYIKDQSRVDEIQRRCCMLLDNGKSWDYIGVKIAQSKLLADTVKGEHGFSAALKSFLEMIRSLILKAAAMLKLGKAINQALSDEQVREKMDADFLQLVDDVVAQDIEYLRELQLEDGLKAMQRVIAARQQAKADTRVKRRRKAKTPVLDKAEKNHGKKVREAARKKRKWMPM